MNSVHLIEVGKANGGPKFIRAAVRILGCEIEDITVEAPNPDRASSRPRSNAVRRDHQTLRPSGPRETTPESRSHCHP